MEDISLFVRTLNPLFWTSGDVCPGFQSQGGFLRFTSGGTPADLLMGSMAAEPLIHIRAHIKKALVRLEPGIKCAVQCALRSSECEVSFTGNNLGAPFVPGLQPIILVSYQIIGSRRNLEDLDESRDYGTSLPRRSTRTDII